MSNTFHHCIEAHCYNTSQETYRQISNISRPLVSNKIVDHSDIHIYSRLNTLRQWIGQRDEKHSIFGFGASYIRNLTGCKFFALLWVIETWYGHLRSIELPIFHDYFTASLSNVDKCITHASLRTAIAPMTKHKRDQPIRNKVIYIIIPIKVKIVEMSPRQ